MLSVVLLVRLSPGSSPLPVLLPPPRRRPLLLLLPCAQGGLHNVGVPTGPSACQDACGVTRVQVLASPNLWVDEGVPADQQPLQQKQSQAQHRQQTQQQRGKPSRR